MIPAILAAILAASPVDTAYTFDHNGTWKEWMRPDGARCTSGPEPIGDELCLIYGTGTIVQPEPDTIGYWLDWKGATETKGEWVDHYDTVWVFRKR